MTAATVTFTLPEGTKVTCSVELARKLGHSKPQKAPAKKAASKKSDD